MNFLGSQEEKEQETIELTSLIDVMFMLVLFFMITTTFASAPGFKVDLPKTSAQESIREKKDVTVVIDRENSYAIDQRQVTQAELLSHLYETGKQAPDTLVIIQADREVSHGRVVEVMDFAKQAGLRRLAIATDPSKDNTTP